MDGAAVDWTFFLDPIDNVVEHYAEMKKLAIGKFKLQHRQTGYRVVSYSKEDMNRLMRYCNNNNLRIHGQTERAEPESHPRLTTRIDLLPSTVTTRQVYETIKNNKYPVDYVWKFGGAFFMDLLQSNVLDKMPKTYRTALSVFALRRIFVYKVRITPVMHSCKKPIIAGCTVSMDKNGMTCECQRSIITTNASEIRNDGPGNNYDELVTTDEWPAGECASEEDEQEYGSASIASIMSSSSSQNTSCSVYGAAPVNASQPSSTTLVPVDICQCGFPQSLHDLLCPADVSVFSQFQKRLERVIADFEETWNMIPTSSTGNSVLPPSLYELMCLLGPMSSDHALGRLWTAIDRVCADFASSTRVPPACPPARKSLFGVEDWKGKAS